MQRDDGYAAIRDYAIIGDGRTAALVARDGSIDWLCLPDVDSPSVFARLLDARRGGSFTLAPDDDFETERRYEPSSNVLETTFRTSGGAVRVVDAMTLADRTWLSPLREVVRKVEGLAGSVRLSWRFEPRFGYARGRTTMGLRSGRHVASSGATALALATWGAGDEQRRGRGVEGTFDLHAGETALLSLSAAHQDPLVLTGRDDVEGRLERTRRFWVRWADACEYDGRWGETVLRSALALKLLVYAPSGAIVAAPTTSLPEWIGGTRNWDYRFTWIRDAAYTLVALLRLGFTAETRAFFGWVAHATAQTQPELKVLYRLDGALDADEEELPYLDGYRGSAPVRVGNAAAAQTQLDVYGPMLETVWLYAAEHGTIDVQSGRGIAKVADWVCRHWRLPDSGIWEVRSEPTHFVQSKAMCWVALDRAAKLAERGLIPDGRARWLREAAAIRQFVREQGWDGERGSYVRAPDLRELDASLLTMALFEYDDPAGPRVRGTIDAVRRELSEGPFVYRYRGDDGVEGEEGYFLTCSFWLAGALAKSGRVDDAIELMDELVALANDVGLYAEEVGPDGDFLGNFPQALVHLGLVNAAVTIAQAERAP